MAYLSLPDGSYYKVPEGMNPRQAYAEARKKYPDAFGAQQEVKAKQPGIIESGVAGAKKLGSSIRTAVETPFGVEEAAQAGLARARALEEKTPSALSLEKVKEKYAQEGFFPAAGEVLRQAPSFVAEQIPQLGAAFAGGRTGAMLGAPLGPVGSTVMGIAGAVTPLFLQSYGSGAERRAAEGLQQDPGKTALSASGQAGLEYASMVIPFGGKLMGRILGLPAKEAEQALLSPAARKLAEERLATSIAKGTAGGVLANVPTEVSQQMLERWQANLPLMDDNALKEYQEAAYGASLFGGPFGGVGRRAQVGQAKEEVARADALEAAKKATELREEEAAEKAKPEYALRIGDQFEALQEQEKALLAARGKKPGKDATDEQKEVFAQQTEELQTLRNELKALAPEYKEVKAKLPALREEKRVAGITPQEYQLEQMGLAEEPAAVPEARTMADLQAPALFEAASPAARLEKDTEDALAGLQYYNRIQPLSDTDLRNGAVDILMRNPARAQALVDNDLPIPGFSTKESKTIRSLLVTQLKNAPKAALAAEKEALQRMGADVRGQRELGETSRLFEQIDAQQRDFEKAASEERTEKLAGDLAGTLAREARELTPAVAVEPGLQKQNYEAIADEFNSKANDAVADLRYTANKLNSAEAQGTSNEATALRSYLTNKFTLHRGSYIDAVLQETANVRAARGMQPLSTDVATKEAVELARLADELAKQKVVVNERAMKEELDALKETYAKLKKAPSLDKLLEAQRSAKTPEELAKVNELLKLRDAQQPFKERVAAVVSKYRGAANDKYKSAVEEILERMDAVRDQYINYRPALRKQGLPTEGPLAAQSSYREAQRVAEERGETAQTLEGQLRRQRDYVGALLERAVQTRAVADKDTRDLLAQVQDSIEDGTATREMLDVAEDIATRMQRGQSTQAELPKLQDAMRSVREAQAPGLEGGQRALFGEEDLGVVRATAANFRRFLASKPVEALRKTLKEAKAAIEAKRPPYAAAQAATKAAKLKDQIKDKEVSILQSIRDLSVQIREQRGQALYGPIIQKFEQQAQVFEARLAELEASMPEGGRMSPDLDAMFTEAQDLKEETAKARAAVQEARTRQEKDDSNTALLAAADERIVKDKDRLAALEKKLADVDFIGEERRAAQAEAGKLRRDTAVAEGKLREAKELQSKQEEARKRRIATGEGMQKLTRTVVPVERVTKSGKRIVMKEKGTGLPVQQKKTTGAFAERAPVKGLDWKATKEAKPATTARTLSLENEEDVKAQRRRLIQEAGKRGDVDEVKRLRAEGRAEFVANAQRVSAAENLKDLAKTARTLAQQEKVTDIAPKPKRAEPLRGGSQEAKEEKATRKQTAAEKRKLARDMAEGVASEYDAGLAFRTAKAPATPVDAAEAKMLIVGTLSKLPKGVNLVYEPTLEGMKPETLKRLVSFGYKPGSAFKGVVLPDDGTIVVVGDQHTNVKDLEETLFHEMVGHYGIDTVIGMDRLKKYASATDLEKLAKKLGGDPLWTHAVDAMTFATEQKGDPDLAALREIIAYTGQQRITENFKQKAGRWLQELVGMVRSSLRQIGFKNMAEMSTSDVFYALKMANKAFNERTVGPYRAEGGVMAFRTKTEPSRYGSSFVGSQKGIIDKLRGNMLGLSGRVQFVDQYAALDAAIKKGLDAGVISDLEAEQAGYYLRFGQQANAFATQALTNGPLSLVKQMTKRGMEFVYKSAPGANMVKVAQALEKSGIKNSTELEQMFTIYVAGKRAKQLTGGWNKLNFSDPAAAEADYTRLMAELRGNDKARAAFEEAAKIYKEYNNGLIDFAAQTGYLSQQKAAELKAIDYVPFYRVQGGELQLMVDKERPVRIANIKDEPMLHELVGDNTQILPIFTSSAQNAFVLTRMGLRNQMMKDNVMLLGRLGIASKIGKGAGPQGPNTVRYKVKGEDNFAVIDSDMYGIPAELIVKGMEGIKTTIPMAIKVMGVPADVLRKFITRNPAYAVRQAIRDPLTAWFTTGVDGVPVLNSMKELGKMVAGRSKEETELMQAGAISSNVMTGDEQDMAKAMRDVSLGRSGWAKWMMRADALAMQGDAATRAVIYKDSLAKGMSEMQAYMRTLESMNFSRRGLSPSIQMLSTVIPFFNAQIQGLDVLYRAFTGKMPYSEQLKIRQKLYTRGLLLAAGTVAYAAAMEDDEAYKNASPEERLGNWFVYTPFSDEPMRVPIPFELGYLFKALPEALFNMAAEDERASDITKGMGKLLGMSNPFALPAAIKPATEVILGRSFFGGDIESKRELTTMMPGERYREGTTEIAKMLGSITGDAGLTPIKIDYLIRGYTGMLGAFALDATDALTNPDRMDKPINRLPQVSTFMYDPTGRGYKSDFYRFREDIDRVVDTVNLFKREGRGQELLEYLTPERAQIYAMRGIVSKVQDTLSNLRKHRNIVANDPNMSGEEKRQITDDLLAREKEILLAYNVPALREMAGR